MNANPIEQFRDAIRCAGLQPPDAIEADGKLHRFASNGKRGDDAGWYALHDNGIPAGSFGDWRTGVSEIWRADIGRTLTPAEEAAHRANVEAMQRAREAEKARQRAEAAKKAAAIWKAATPASADHPYLTRKGVKASESLREIHTDKAAAILGYRLQAKGEALAGRLLVAPVKVGDKVSTAELIDEAGRKSAIAGGAKAGGYWAAQTLPQGDGAGLVLLIGEGVATVLSAKEASGHPSIAALSASNLPAVAQYWRNRYLAAALVILADLVKATGKPDPHAIEAARAVGGLLAVPDFGDDRPEGATDFNDLARHRGPEAVRACIEAAARPLDVSQCDGEGREDEQAGAVAQNTAAHAEKAEIARLAALSPIEYDRQREEAAKRLNIRTSTLDAEVKRLRGEAAGDSERGSALQIDDPEPWPNPVSAAELFREIIALVESHIVLPDHAAAAIALWVLHTYAFDYGRVTPTLAIKSPTKGCGKTMLLSLLTTMVSRPLPASNISPAAVFRVIDAVRPTLLIDEADSFLRDNEELRGVLNSTHTRDMAYVVRVVGDDNEPRKFSTWAPKAIALIGKLPETLHDRSIAITLQRKPKGVRVAQLPLELDCTEIRQKCARWVADHAPALRSVQPAVPEQLQNRAADNWRPLLALADLAGGDWPKRAREVACALSGAGSEPESESIQLLLLTDIRQAFADKRCDKMFSSTLCKALADMAERPWPEFNRGKPISQRQLAGILGGFGIKSGSVRVDLETSKGYHLSQFNDAFSRYLGDSSVTASQPNIGARSSDFSNVTPKNAVTDEKSLEANTGAGCDVVTNRKGGNGENDGNVVVL